MGEMIPGSAGVRAEVNDRAARAMRDWLVFGGLAAEIDDLRFQEEGRVVPAPGLEDLRRHLEDVVRQVCERAEGIAVLTTDPDISEVADAIDATSRALGLAADEVAFCARQLAQLGDISGTGARSATSPDTDGGRLYSPGARRR